MKYPRLSVIQLHNLAEKGVVALQTTPAVTVQIQHDTLTAATSMRKAKDIDLDSYRTRLRMVVNHCRKQVEKTWESSPNVPKSVSYFLGTCRKNEAKKLR